MTKNVKGRKNSYIYVKKRISKLPKILHISSAKTWRGGEQQLAYLIEELAQKKVPQIVLCAADSAMEKHCQTQKIPCYSYRKRFSINPLVGRKIIQICQKETINLIHVHDSHAHTFAFLAARFSKIVPVILVSRRVDFPIKKNWFSKQKYEHPKIACVLCVSDFIRKMVQKSLPQKRVETVYSGIDRSRFLTASKGILRKEFNLKNDDPIIANVAAIAPHKDYFTWVNTVEILRKKGIKANFFIIGGDGGELVDIQQFIEEKGLEKDIIFTGFRKDIPQLLPEIDVLLFSSKTEGLGTTILDAFASKTLVVTTDAGGIPELVKDGETGLIAPVGDFEKLAENVGKILHSPQGYQQLVENAFEKGKNYSKEATARRTLEVYLEIAQKKVTQ